MKVFLSWSGDRSRSVAETLRETLPLLMSAVKPWISDQDIDKGERWNTVLTEVLGSAKIGIFCLTPDNIDRPSLLFEAGSVAKTEARVCVLLDGLKPSVLSWPWNQFQYTKLDDKNDMFKLLSNVNRWLDEAGEPALSQEQFTKTLSMWWPSFQNELAAKPTGAKVQIPERSEKDMLVEVLELLRGQKRDANWFEKALVELKEMQALTVRGAEYLQQTRLFDEERRRETDRLIPPVRDVMVTALTKAGYGTAAAELENAIMSFDTKGGLIVQLPWMREAMLKQAFNEEAKAVMSEALIAAGFHLPGVSIRPPGLKSPETS